jgi:putative SbcD/Mre11-related phosphoesterase
MSRRRADQPAPPALAAGPDGWGLAPEGAAVRLDARTAVIADVHLGYEWSRGARGDLVPAHSLAETIAKLARLIGRAPIDRLVVAGDLVESRAPCPRTDRDVQALRAWLGQQGVELVWLRGNHDPARRPALPDTFEIGGWTIAHGHRPEPGARLVIGHHHPVLRCRGAVAPCFLVGPSLMALPAFSPNAAGLDVLSEVAALPPILRDDALGLWAVAGDEVLDFGDAGGLRKLVARSARRAPAGSERAAT